MKIGLVCPYSVQVPGGVQNQVLGLAGYLTRQGEQVAIIAPGTLGQDRLDRHGLRPGQFTSAGPAVGVRYNGSIARVNPGPQAAARLRRWLTSFAPDVLHLHEPITPSIGLSALRHARTPVVATFHTATPRSRALRLAGGLLARCIDKITTPIAVSRASRQVVRQYLGRDPIIIPNGFSRADFACATDLTQRCDSPAAAQPKTEGSAGRPDARITFLGRLNEPRKGLSVLMAALPQLRRLEHVVDVVIAGQGRGRIPKSPDGQVPKTWRRARWKTASLASWSTMSVRVAGEVSDPERARLLASSDLFVAPHTDRESFGIVLLEAMAAGATVVASDLEPFTDLLTGPAGPLGFSFPAGDPDALAATIQQALNTDRTTMNRQAAHATTRFDWHTVGDQIRDEYEAALSHPRVSHRPDGDGWL